MNMLVEERPRTDRVRTPNTFTYAMAQTVYRAWLYNDLILSIIYGAYNMGKSAYALKIMMDLWDDPKGDRLDEWKAYITFKPESFIGINQYLLKKKLKAKLVIWDDAGLWMNALDWQDKNVISALKFLNVAKTTMAGLMMTTPELEMILKKVLRIEGIHIGKVMINNRRLQNDRICKIYQNNISPWGARFIDPVMEDRFSRMLPDHVWEWYRPLRDSYAEEAMQIMARNQGFDVDFSGCKSAQEAYAKIYTFMQENRKRDLQQEREQ